MPLLDTAKSLAINLIACGASEVTAKAPGLLVVVAVARRLDLTQIGIAASAAAAGDMRNALPESGFGQRSAWGTDPAQCLCNRLFQNAVFRISASLRSLLRPCAKSLESG